MDVTTGPTKRLFFEDSGILEFDARVVERRLWEGKPAVILDRTAFYAESGGQPWDRGTLGGVPVLKVIEDGDDLVHVLERPLAADDVRGAVDGNRRLDHMQQHSGQHAHRRRLARPVRADQPEDLAVVREADEVRRAAYAWAGYGPVIRST